MDREARNVTSQLRDQAHRDELTHGDENGQLTGVASDKGTSSGEYVYLRRAVELSGTPGPATGDLPFGAVVVLEGLVLSEARNQVASRCDPTAHAEILALRAAAEHVGGPELAGAVLYSSSEPCPMCLAACYWARIERVVHAASLDDTAECGFEDSAFYRELALPRRERSLRLDFGDRRLYEQSVRVLRARTA